MWEENIMNQRKKLISIILVMVLAFTMFAGCSKKADSTDPILGTWTATEIGGMNIAEINELSDEEMPAITMEYKNDGTGTAAFSEEKESFSWEKDGEAYLLNLGYNEKNNATITDNVLTISVEGGEMKFEKK